MGHMTLVSFACFCARQNWNLLTDKRIRKTVEIAEAFVRGEASADDCYADADVSDASRAATYAAYAADVADAAHAATYASLAATYAAHAADDAYNARDAVRAAQSKWLVENCEV